LSQRKLKAWEQAGLIDAETAERIRAWEADHARPLLLWAVIGIAALAIGLGIISVVAANWDDIPGIVRLAIHFALMAGIAGFLLWKARELAGQQPWMHEAALFVFGLLGLTFLGHVGQVYQTSSPLWQPIALWLVLFAPLLLLEGLSWLIAAAIMVMLVIATSNYAIQVAERMPGLGDIEQMVRIATAVSAPVLVAGLGAWGRRASTREAFWRRLEQLGLVYGVALASLVIVVSAFDRWPADEDAGLIFGALAIGAVTGLAASALVWWARPGISGRAQAHVLQGGALTVLFAYAMSDSQTLAGILFMVFWAGIAASALYAGWRGVFQVAVGVVALRLIVLSFELASDLLTSGAGLIASGLLILGVAWVALRVSRQFAPQAEEQP
jgi:uncharacterized membrane protein